MDIKQSSVATVCEQPWPAATIQFRGVGVGHGSKTAAQLAIFSTHLKETKVPTILPNVCYVSTLLQ